MNTRTLCLEKEGHTYLFRYAQGLEDEVVEEMMCLADDHEMVRRIDGDVWPPFYEQPWARSSGAAAWDGLPKYDLAKFNPWYFGRLKEFASHCDSKGTILFHNFYMQHALLETLAHYVDFPWRPVNCIQDTAIYQEVAVPDKVSCTRCGRHYCACGYRKVVLYYEVIRSCVRIGAVVYGQVVISVIRYRNRGKIGV